MAETITILGRKFPKNAVFIIGGGTVAIIGYAWWTRGTRAEEIPTEFEDATEVEDLTGGVDFPGTTVSGSFGQPAKTDQEWFNEALDKLMFDYGLDNTAAASDTLNRYLNQIPMSAEQQKQIAYVINSIGPPPSGSRTVRLETAGTSGIGAVTGLKAVKNSNNSVTLSWNPVASATSYQVKRASGPGSPATATTSAISRTTPVLTPGTYVYEVRARSSSGSYGTAASVNISISTTAAKTLSAPARVTAIGGKDSARISWSSVPGASGYRIRVEGSNVEGVWKTTTKTSYNAVYPVSRATTVAYRVQTLGPGGAFGGNRVSNSVSIKP